MSSEYFQNIIEIVNLCRSVDQTAVTLYQKYSSQARSTELREFWTSMAADAKEYIAFWDELAAMCHDGILPTILENPKQVLEELTYARDKINDCLKNYHHSSQLTSAFFTAFRIEFLRLHPAVETFFQIARPSGAADHIGKYENHLSRFLEMLNRYAVTPELEMLGEAVQSLWKNIRALVAHNHIDPLTEVYNRRGLFHLIKLMANLAQRKQYTVGLLMCDIDFFKKINDTYGHQAGDRVLKGIGAMIKSQLRSYDIVGRYGGEEFLVFLSNCEPESVGMLGEKIRAHVESTPIDDIKITISVGGTFGQPSQNTDTDIETFIKRADDNLYTAKKSGRNKVIMDTTKIGEQP